MLRRFTKQAGRMVKNVLPTNNGEELGPCGAHHFGLPSIQICLPSLKAENRQRTTTDRTQRGRVPITNSDCCKNSLIPFSIVSNGIHSLPTLRIHTYIHRNTLSLPPFERGESTGSNDSATGIKQIPWKNWRGGAERRASARGIVNLRNEYVCQ